MQKFFLSLLLFVPFLGLGQSIDSLVENRVAMLQKSIQNHDVQPLLPLLADSCRVATYRGEQARAVLRAVVVQFPTPDTLFVQKSRTEGAQTEVEISLSSNGKMRPASFVIDGQGRFTRIDLVKGVQVVQTRVTPIHTVPCCEIPFITRNGFIILNKALTVNGQQGIFVLDSGCQSVVFNSSSAIVAPLISGEGTSQRYGVASSSVERKTGLLSIDSLAVGENLFAIKAQATDLSALAKQFGLDELTGLIGASILKHFETHIDYAKGVVRFYALTDEGCAVDAPQPIRRIGFDLLKDYLPCFEVHCGQESLRMVFDTGAQECCITPACSQRLGRHYRRAHDSRLRDADSVVRVESGRIDRLVWSDTQQRKVQAVVRDLSQLGDIDGILGYPMVAGRHISLNYARREFCFY